MNFETSFETKTINSFYTVQFWPIVVHAVGDFYYPRFEINRWLLTYSSFPF